MTHSAVSHMFEDFLLRSQTNSNSWCITVSWQMASIPPLNPHPLPIEIQTQFWMAASLTMTNKAIPSNPSIKNIDQWPAIPYSMSSSRTVARRSMFSGMANQGLTGDSGHPYLVLQAVSCNFVVCSQFLRDWFKRLLHFLKDGRCQDAMRRNLNWMRFGW